MKFLTGTELYKAVQVIASGQKPRFAVAFWGEGSQKLVGDVGNKTIQIICNLKMGGTNPLVIEDLLECKVPVQQHDTLHAKVYLNETAAIVASANASANGLGLEGAEQAFWEEAGVLIDDPQAISDIKHWFTRMWSESRKIKDDDLKRAEKVWMPRQRAKPSLRSFADFDVSASNLPLIDWFGDKDWDINPKFSEGKTKAALDYLEEQIDDGIIIEGPEDNKVLTPGRWVLWFKRTSKGQPSRQVNLLWACYGPILEDACKYTWERKFRPVALKTDNPGPEPFPITKEFQDLFVKVILRDEFKQLRTDDYDGAWFIPERVRLIKKFWKTLHSEYTDLAAHAVEAAA